MVTLPTFLDRFFFSWYHLADLCNFYSPRGRGDLKTNPQNLISLGASVSEVKIILKQEKKNILTKAKEKVCSQRLFPSLDPVKSERTVESDRRRNCNTDGKFYNVYAIKANNQRR